VKGFLLWALTLTIGVLTILVLLLETVYWQMMSTDHHGGGEKGTLPHVRRLRRVLRR
jgi:hypothetical protein